MFNVASLSFYLQRFYQYLASNNCTFHLDNYIDKTHPNGKRIVQRLLVGRERWLLSICCDLSAVVVCLALEVCFCLRGT